MSDTVSDTGLEEGTDLWQGGVVSTAHTIGLFFLVFLLQAVIGRRPKTPAAEPYSADEIAQTAWHEAGHATVVLMLCPEHIIEARIEATKPPVWDPDRCSGAVRMTQPRRPTRDIMLEQSAIYYAGCLCELMHGYQPEWATKEALAAIGCAILNYEMSVIGNFFFVESDVAAGIMELVDEEETPLEDTWIAWRVQGMNIAPTRASVSRYQAGVQHDIWRAQNLCKSILHLHGVLTERICKALIEHKHLTRDELLAIRQEYLRDLCDRLRAAHA